jgi:hypothetical protein
MTNSTVSTNSATGSFGFGGGISNVGVINLNHRTILNNSASQSSGGVINSPCAGCGSGSSTVNSRNSIFADNTAPARPDFTGILTSQGYNLIENTNNEPFITGTTTGNILGRDPQRLPLGNYGGATQTHALKLTSPALDKGGSVGVAADQRGQPRPVNFPNIPNAVGGN